MPDDTPANALRAIPSINELCSDPDAEGLIAGSSRALVVAALRRAVAVVRASLLDGEEGGSRDPAAMRERIWALAREEAAAAVGPHFRHVVNATGIILHTGLGRAAVGAAAMRQLEEHFAGYSLLQLDTESGRRGSRDARIEWLLQQLTGCEAATLVNNNAAATMLVLNTAAAGREVIVSRGQLVEIGGSFRLPDVMKMSGARMVEVGTTNKTHLRDYEEAITPETAAILRVHPSNYEIRGFSSTVPLAALEPLAHANGLILIDDVGAGALVDFSRFGFHREPTLPESVATGADLITASADKLIGASQGGIILGRKSLIERVRKNPMTRALRVGKLDMAVLEATLVEFLKGEESIAALPTIRMLSTPQAALAAAAWRIANAVNALGGSVTAETLPGCSQMGSGSLPGQDLPTTVVALRTPSANAFARLLRQGTPPVFSRIQEDRVLLDPRTLLPGDEDELVRRLAEIISRPATDG